MLCEGYLGVRPSVGLWCRLFNFRSFRVGTGVFTTDPKTGKKVETKVTAECGASVIYMRKAGLYPHPTPPQSIKDRQMGFFYVSSPEDQDLLNLPEFSLPPPNKHNWSEKLGDGDTDLDRQMDRIAELMGEGLLAANLAAGYDEGVTPRLLRVRLPGVPEDRRPARSTSGPSFGPLVTPT